MVNYYKILGLDNYAPITEVKQAYKKLIKQYHPDINSEKDAEELTKYLNLAKDILYEPVSKTAYDKQLRLAYLIEINRIKNQQTLRSKKTKAAKGSYWQSLTKEERVAKIEELKKLKIKEKYEKSLNRFPLHLRVIGILIFLVWSIQMMATHYFLGYTAKDYILAVLGYFIFGGTLAVASSEVYTYYASKSVRYPVIFNYEKWIARIFTASFFVVIGSISILNKGIKMYLLSTDFEYTTATIDFERTTLDKLVIYYEIDAIQYVKKMNVQYTDVVKIQDHKMVLKFAKFNPLICEPILKEDWETLHQEIKSLE